MVCVGGRGYGVCRREGAWYVCVVVGGGTELTAVHVQVDKIRHTCQNSSEGSTSCHGNHLSIQT